MNTILKTISIIIILVFSNIANAQTNSQETKPCAEIAKLTMQAIKDKSPEQILPYLSDDFSIAGRDGKIAKGVLNQLITQLKVNSIKKQDIIKNDKTTEFRYNVDFEGLGEKQSSITFDENCKIKTLELLKIQVKTLEKGETKINIPDDKIIEIPFVMSRNLITVKANLDGVERNFIFDSGAPKIILNSNHIGSKKSKKSISSAKGVTNNNLSGMDIVNVENLNFGGITLKNQPLVTTDFSHFEKGLEIELYGIIGYEMYKDYDLYIDYENLIIKLIKPEYFEMFKAENLMSSKLIYVPFKMDGHIPVLEVDINGKKLNFGIDSGAESNLLEDKLFETFKKDLRKIKTDNLYGGSDVPVKIKSGLLKEMTINGKVFKKSKTVFSNIDHLNEGKDFKTQGLIGYPTLSKQKILISYKRKQLIFID